MIDGMVDAGGRPITLEYITDPVFEHDVVSWPDSTTEKVDSKAIVSSIDEKDTQRLEGRVSDASVKLVVPTDLNVKHDRHAARDRVHIDDRVFEVVYVEELEHPFASATKKTVYARSLDGHT